MTCSEALQRLGITEIDELFSRFSCSFSGFENYFTNRWYDAWAERSIAQALALTPQEIWPTRYWANGKRKTPAERGLENYLPRAGGWAALTAWGRTEAIKAEQKPGARQQALTEVQRLNALKSRPTKLVCAIYAGALDRAEADLLNG